MKKLGIIVLVVLCTLGLAITACEKKTEELKVGTLMSITGPLKEYGPAIQKGIDLAAKQLTEAGLPVKLFPEDSETSAIPATNAAKKLVEVDNVAAIIGALASGVTQPVAESVTCPAGVILISPASTSPLLTNLPADQGKDVLFRTCPSDSLQGVVSGKVAAGLYKTISILYVNNAYGQGLAEWFKQSYEENGGKVLAMVPHDEKASASYTAELKSALADQPEALAAFSYPEHAKVYIKEAIEFFKFKTFYFCDGTKSEVIIQSVGAENLEGMMGTAPGSTGGKALEAFNTAFKQAYGMLPPLPFITNGYDAMAVIGLAAYQAMTKDLPLTSANIRDQLRSVANAPGTVIMPGEFQKAFELIKKGEDINYEGAAGAQDFDANGDVITPIEVWKYTGGKIETVRME